MCKTSIEKNYKTSLREIKIYINWCINHIHIGSLITIKFLISPKICYRFKEIILKVLVVFAYFCFCFLMELDKLISQFLWKCKGQRIVKTFLEKKNSMGGLPFHISSLTILIKPGT